MLGEVRGGKLVIDTASGGGVLAQLTSPADPVHQIEPATVPSLGLRLERRTMLARGTDGLPVLWQQRRRLPLLAPPAQHGRFDVMQEAIEIEA